MDSDIFISRYGNQLNEQQLQAVESIEGPILLLAVPGSGKTTVLVTRIGYMILCKNIPPENILVLTYTIAATKDMGQRFASIFGDELASEVEFRTINGICAKIIQEYGRKIGKEPFELITDEKETNRIVSGILEGLLPEYPTESDVRTIKTWITYCKNMMLSEDEIKEIGEREEIPLYETYERYNQCLKSNRKMDYDDQMIYALSMLRTDAELLYYYRRQFQYICVDEAQDTSKIQHTIIGLLAGVNGNLFMVGDEDQSIYGFRAAYPEALLNFEKVHSKAKVLIMNQNYRSNAKIVDLADCFIQRNLYRHQKTMQAVRGEGNDVRYVELKSRNNQYNYLLKVARDCRQEIAVLYRLNESSLPMVDLLDRNRIPFRIKGLEMTFFTHRVVQDVINMIRFAQNPYDADLFMKIYYKIQTYLRKNQAESMCLISQNRKIPVLEAAKYVSGVSGMVVGKCNSARIHFANMLNETPDRAIYRIVNYMGYGEYMERNGMDTNKIFILTNLAYREKTLQSFEKRMGYLYGLLKNMQTDYNAKFILSTIHSSKGLEYDEVYLMDVCDGVFPQTPSLITAPESYTDQKNGEEERRLFYVGMTRAKDRLNIFTFTSEESVFVNELKNPGTMPREKRGFAEGASKKNMIQEKPKVIEKSVPKPKATIVSDTATQAAYGVEQARELLEILKALRLSLAHAEKVPAYCIFSDKVLIRMAEVKPVAKWQMLEISGVGENKYTKYGEQFLSVIRGFLDGQKPVVEVPGKELEKEVKVQVEKPQTANTKPKEKEDKTPAKKGKETYVFKGETYYLINGKWYNSGYTKVNKETMYDLNDLRIKKLNFDDVEISELISMAQEMKDSEDYIFSKKLFETIFEKCNDQKVIRSILSRYTSILRKLQQPREAIELAEKYISIYGKGVTSPTLFTSLAGAYCDIGDTTEARKKANIAMSMCGGNAGPELQSVYARIKAMER